MTKVHPNAPAPSEPSSTPVSPSSSSCSGGDEKAAMLTVWRKSLLFNCSGFTVFDCKGNLVYRVDNYAAGNRGEIVLMDAIGEPLLTIRRKRLSLGDHWLIYDEEETSSPRFSVRKHVHLLQSKALAHVTDCGGGGKQWAYVIEGSYASRSCAVYDGKKREAAEIRRKEAAKGGAGFGNDVFRLVVQPGVVDCAVAMAFVILLDQMYGTR